MPHNSRLSHCLPQEPVDGAPIVAAVLFQEAEGEPAATLVTLRISYLLPRALLGLCALKCAMCACMPGAV